MSPSLRVALVKPDWGFRGGGEIAVDHVVALLEADGHRVRRHQVDVPSLPREPFGLAVPPLVWDAAPEYFRHLAALEAVERLSFDDADLVLSTQPPSYAAHHRHHLSLFFHHLRVLYDLSALYQQAGFVEDPELHLAAQARLREVEERRLQQVSWFAPISEAVQDRLRTFSGIDTDARSSVVHFGVGFGQQQEVDASAEPGRGEVLCVSRSEFPKRTELFVHALRYRPEDVGVLVGEGGRLAWVQVVEERLCEGDVDLDGFTAEELWLNKGEAVAAEADAGRPSRSNVRFAGRVSDAELLALYRQAPCVVAPAYEEDYGLTALEAMAHGRPVVCCTDGGGLRSFVQDEVNGLVVEPTGRAIGEAVGRIVDDPDLARQLGQGALDTGRRFTWSRCAQELRHAVEQAMAG